MEDFVDIKEADVGCTRGTKVIDRVFLNNYRSVTESGTVVPLETEEDDPAKSDHRVAHVKIDLPRVEAFK